MAGKQSDLLPAKAGEGNLPVIRGGEDLHSLVHNTFTADKFNVLVPKAMSFAPGIKVAIQMVELDSQIDEKKKRSKDFWTIDKEDYILSSNAIRKIAGAANVQWVPAECKVESEQYEEGGQVLRLRYKAVCYITTSLGTVKNGIGTYEYNYNQDLKDPRFQEKYWDDKLKKYVTTGNLKWDQINQRRQFALQLVESGAKARAIYDAFGIMEKSYKKADISKPFIIPCAVHDIDYNDPGVKRLLAERALGIKSEIYGVPPPIPAQFEVLPEGTVDRATGEMVDPPQSQPSQGAPPMPEPPKRQEPTDADKRALYQDQWSGATQKERGDKIEKLLDVLPERRKYVKDHNYTKADTWNNDTQMAWLMNLAVEAGEIPAEAANA